MYRLLRLRLQMYSACICRFPLYFPLTLRIRVQIHLQYICGYIMHNTLPIHPRYMNTNVFRSAPLGYIWIQCDTSKSMYLPLGCLCAPRYALNTPKIRVSAPSLPAFTFFTCPDPPEEGLAPPPRRWSPARAEGFAPRPESSSSMDLSSTCPSSCRWWPAGSAR